MLWKEAFSDSEPPAFSSSHKNSGCPGTVEPKARTHFPGMANIAFILR